jgi:O-antigen/teichoic acid export membrane protein
MLLTPLLFMALASGILVSRGSTSAWVAVLLQVAATAAGFLVGAALLRRSLPDEVRVAAPRTDVQSWRRSAGALATLNVVSAANAQIGTILLATLATAADAGLFNVAYRTTIFISFAMVAATYPISPLVARLHAAGESVRLEETVVRAARLVLAFSIPVAVTLILFAPAILDLFGSGFDAGATAVRIVAVGDVVNVVTGFGGVLLVMCGREADLARSVALGAVLNVGLTAALVPRYGVDGAAAATAVGLAASNLLMTWLAWRRLGIYAAVVRLPATARRA